MPLLCAVSEDDVADVSSEELDPVCSDNAARFYRRVMSALAEEKVPFLVGGAFALCHYARVVRETKDLDIFLRRADLDAAFRALEKHGFSCAMVFPHWLAKAKKGKLFADLIFSSGNGVATVDDAWFEHAQDGTALGMPVRICPAEESLWSKAFIMERERYDGADVAHLLRACADGLDWDRLMQRFGAHWRVLLSHLVLFGLIYPAERAKIPARIMQALTARLAKEGPEDVNDCGGTLISREQYLVDVDQWGYDDARLEQGYMREEEIAVWTAAIKR